MKPAEARCKQPVIAFGPELPGIGSWEWIGVDTMRELSHHYSTVIFTPESIPDCDALFIVKYGLPLEQIIRVTRTARLIYCPVDYYGSSAEIDADARILLRCSRIIIHCHRLRKYFQSYATCEFIDHHVRFVPTSRPSYRERGYVLWVGMRTHLPTLADFVNTNPLPGELRILTNLEESEKEPSPENFGFHIARNPIRIERWTRQRHLELTSGARCAIDIKGDDFRQRHKPPAKAIDFVAAGLPLATNPDSSSAEHLAMLGFATASPLDERRWLSREYFDETQRFAAKLRESLSLNEIARRYRQIIDAVLAENKAAVATHCSE